MPSQFSPDSGIRPRSSAVVRRSYFCKVSRCLWLHLVQNKHIYKKKGNKKIQLLICRNWFNGVCECCVVSPLTSQREEWGGEERGCYTASGPAPFHFDHLSKLRMHPSMTQSEDAAEPTLFARSPTQEREKKQSHATQTYTYAQTHTHTQKRLFCNPLALRRSNNWSVGRSVGQLVRQVPPSSASIHSYFFLPPCFQSFCSLCFAPDSNNIHP